MAGHRRRGRTSRKAALAFAGLFAHVLPRAAHAQGVAGIAGDEALAQALFEDGQRLMDEGRYAEACPRLAESQRIDPAGGTLLNLGVCRELEGRTATAWATFKEALAVARRDGRADRESLAEERLAALEPRLSRLRVDVPASARVAGLVVAIDGVELGPAGWGIATPVDPGTHRIVASAPRHRPWQTDVTVGEPGASAVATVRALERIEPAAPPAPAASPAASSSDVRRPVGLGLLGLGVIGLGAGTVAGLYAIGKENEARDAGCRSATCPNESALDASNASNDAATAATVLLPAGAVAAAAGVVLLILARPAPARPRRAFVVGGAVPRVALSF